VLRQATGYTAGAVLDLLRAIGLIAATVWRAIWRREEAIAAEGTIEPNYTAASAVPEAERAMGSGASPRVRSRREVLTLASVGMGGFAATVAAIPVIGALVAPLVRPQAPEWRTVGSLSDFRVGETVAVTFEDPSPLSWAGVAAQTGAWLRRNGDQDFTAFAINCTHLGCPVRWLPDAELFMCPCHGGVFYSNGAVAAGPPQRPLFIYPVRINQGQVEVLSGPVRVV
jgi:quinol---cytochrome c reductase iron-sulfur subunit, bacillus type